MIVRGSLRRVGWCGKGMGGWRVMEEGGWARCDATSGVNARVCGPTHAYDGRAGASANDGIGMAPGRRIRRSAHL